MNSIFNGIRPHACNDLQSMKMIASTKLAKAQRAMQAGKEYGLANSGEFQLPRSMSTV